jgi:hypothetical protein
MHIQRCRRTKKSFSRKNKMFKEDRHIGQELGGLDDSLNGNSQIDFSNTARTAKNDEHVFSNMIEKLWTASILNEQ